MSERPEFEYYMGIANQPLSILGGEDSLKSELSYLVEESIYCIEDLEAEIQTLKGKVRELENKENGWQLCPKCNGQGIVSKPSYVAGDQYTWSDTATSHVCDVCRGGKIVPKPPTKDPNITL